MYRIKWLLFTGVLLAVLTAGCSPLSIAIRSTTEKTPERPAGTIPTMLTDTTTGADTVADTVIQSTTVTLAATVAASATEVIPPTPTPTPAVDTPTPTPNPTRVAESTAPMLTIVVASLRIRAGPGTEYTVLGAAAQGERYMISGQANECQWYQVIHPQLATVWISGDAQYVASNIGCDQLAEMTIPAPATPAPVPTAQPTPTPLPPTAPPQDVPCPPDQGYLLLQNQLGPPLTFTFTRADGSWHDTLEVTAEADVAYCLTPGYYRVTIDAPPPWSSRNTEFQINAGDRAYFPIRPQ